jgi:hypothetical protein
MWARAELIQLALASAQKAITPAPPAAPGAQQWFRKIQSQPKPRDPRGVDMNELGRRNTPKVRWPKSPEQACKIY